MKINFRSLIICSFLTSLIFAQCVPLEDPYAQSSGLTVSYDRGGGSGPLPITHRGIEPGGSVYAADPTTAPANLKNEGSKFIAWTTDLVTGFPEYFPGTKVTLGETSIVLYAKWERKDDPKKLAGLWKVTKKDDNSAHGWFAFNGFEYGYWPNFPGANPTPTIAYLADKGLVKNADGSLLLSYMVDRDTGRDMDILIIIIRESGSDVRYRCERDQHLDWSFIPNASGATITAYDPRPLDSNGDRTPLPPGASSSPLIPAKILGLDVTAIGARAFFQMRLNTVTFDVGGSGVTSIGDEAFAYSGLSAITIPATVEQIGARAFQANQLTAITIPSGIKDLIIPSGSDTASPPGILATTPLGGAQFFPGIGVSAFADSTLLDFDISRNPVPATLTTLDLGDSPGPFSIGASAFARAGLSGELSIPAGVKDIGANAFDAYKSNEDKRRNFLTKITFDSNNITIIKNGTFRNNQIYTITYITYPPSLKKIGETIPGAFGTPIGAFEGNAFIGIDIPNSVEEIGPNAFKGNHIANLTLGSSVETIGDGAFSENTISSSLSVPASVTHIGKTAFKQNSLSVLNLSAVAGLSIDDEAFSGNKIGTLTIPSGVTELGKGAFQNNDELTVITITPYGITEIPASAFALSTALENINIPSGITTIGNSAFAHCSNLKTITIPQSVHTIGEMAFFGASSLKEIEIPVSVTRIGEWAFLGAPLTKITKRSSGAITIFNTTNGTIAPLSGNSYLEKAFGDYGTGKGGAGAISLGNTSLLFKDRSGTYTCTVTPTGAMAKDADSYTWAWAP